MSNNQKKKIKIGLISMAVLAGFMLSSCSKKDDTDGARILHIGNIGEPLTLDPQQASGTWEHRILADMFIGLTTNDAAGAAIPGIATDWQTSSDGLVWTFKLRDAKWSDGKPVTADDFVYAYRRLFTVKPPAKYASLLFLFKNAEPIFSGKMPADKLGIKAIDAKTLEISLEHPAPYLPGLLTHYTAMPIPKHIVEKHGEKWIKPENIVTNGPFKITEWVPNDFVHVEKNPNFYDAAGVCLNEIYYYPTQDDTAAERRVKTGKLDIQTNFSGSRLEELNKTLPGFARVSPYLATTYFVFNTKKKPFDDARVREALSISLNREFITEQILKGGQKPAYSLVPPGISGYTSGKVEQDWKKLERSARLEKARKLLKEAGFGPSNPLVFTYKYRNSGDNPRLAPVVQQNWREIGDWVKVEIIGSDVQINYEKLRQGDFDVGDAGWVADFEDARSFLYNFETAAGIMNYGKYSNPNYDTILKQSDNEKNAQKRTELLMKAEKIALDDDAFAPVFFYTNRNLVNPRITGWVDNVNDHHRSRYLCTKEAQSSNK